MAGQGGRTRHPAEMEPRAGSAAPDRFLRLQRARWAAERQRRRPVAEIVCGEVSRRLLQKNGVCRRRVVRRTAIDLIFSIASPPTARAPPLKKGLRHVPLAARHYGTLIMRLAEAAVSAVSALCVALGTNATSQDRRWTSASLIGHSGSSAFRLSTSTVSMSLTGSCFSSESAPGALPSWDSRRGGT